MKKPNAATKRELFTYGQGSLASSAPSPPKAALDFRLAAETEDYIRQAEIVHRFVMKQKDLSPRNMDLNNLLSGFVKNTMRGRKADHIRFILESPRIVRIAPDLRYKLCAAEAEMERYCVRAMTGEIKNADPRYSDFNKFIYRTNYEVLVGGEILAFRRSGRQPPIKRTESKAFVGSGPLPFSSIVYHLRTGQNVTNIDCDEEATHLAGKLIRHLSAKVPQLRGIDRHISCVTKKGEEHDYATHPLVTIAAHVPSKFGVLMRVVRTAHTVSKVGLRTAEKLAQLLYAPVDINAGLEEYNAYLASKSRWSPQAVNTTYVLYFPPGKQWLRNKVNPADAAMAMASPDLDTLDRPKPNFCRIGELRKDI